jgi:CRP/FNR family cyclic AMP-dependent transcriptional regulator
VTEPAEPPAVLEPDQLQRLRDAGRRHTHPQGASIFTEGAASTFAVLIDHGTVMLTTTDADNGYTYVLGLRGADELIGEFGCIEGVPRGASAIAWTSVTATHIPLRHFREVLRTDNDILYVLLRTTIARLREADQLRLEFGAHQGFVRVVRVLVDLADRYGEPIARQHELASFAGVSRETVVRTLRELAKCGAITRSRGRIAITNLNELRAILSGKRSG